LDELIYVHGIGCRVPRQGNGSIGHVEL